MVGSAFYSLFTLCATLYIFFCALCRQTGTTVYRMVLSHPVMLCEIHSIELKNTGSRFYRQFNVHVKTVCLSEFPTPR